MSKSDETRVRDVDVEVEDRRIEEIFEARKRASHILTEASMRDLNQDMVKACYGAVRSYIHVVQDLIDKESEVGEYIWYYAPLGSVEFVHPKTKRTDTQSFKGLQSILQTSPIIRETYRIKRDGFMKGHTSDKVIEKPIPLDVFWNVYSLINEYLADIGFDLNIDKKDGFLDL